MTDRPAKTISVLQKLVNNDSRDFWYPGALQAGLAEHGITVGLKTIRNVMGELINLCDAEAVRDPERGIIGYRGMAKEFCNVSPWKLFCALVSSVEYKTLATVTFYLVVGSYLAVSRLMALFIN